MNPTFATGRSPTGASFGRRVSPLRPGGSAAHAYSFSSRSVDPPASRKQCGKDHVVTLPISGGD